MFYMITQDFYSWKTKIIEIISFYDKVKIDYVENKGIKFTQ